MVIDGVIYEKRRVEHEDDRRTLLTAFNGDLGDFVAKQVKFSVMKKKSTLGQEGHYHDYRELFYMLEGEAVFELRDIKTGEIEEYYLNTRTRLLIPAEVAHKVLVDEDSILVGCTEEPYISPEVNDHKFDF